MAAEQPFVHLLNAVNYKAWVAIEQRINQKSVECELFEAL